MERIARAFARDPRLTEAIRRSASERVVLSGLLGSSRAVAAASLALVSERVQLVVTPYHERALGLAEDLRVLRREQDPIVIAAADEGPADDPDVRLSSAARLVALGQVATARPGDVVLIAAGALLDEFPEPVAPDDRLAVFTTGMVLDRDAILARLAELGYVREPMVTAPGEVSLRGDVMDVYPLTARHPARIEPDDDRTQSIREFDPETQLSVRQLDALEVGRESLTSSRPGERGLSALLARFPAPPLLIIDEPGGCIGALEEAAFERRELEPARKQSRRLLET